MQAGPHLTAAGFVNALNHLRFNVPYWNPVSFTPANHLGTSAVAVFRGDGEAKRWVQIEGFTTSF